MAYYKLRTQINKGKYKGERVDQLVKSIEGQNYLLTLHVGYYNVFLNPEVFRAIADNARVKNGNFVLQHVSESFPPPKVDEFDLFGELSSCDECCRKGTAL